MASEKLSPHPSTPLSPQSMPASPPPDRSRHPNQPPPTSSQLTLPPFATCVPSAQHFPPLLSPIPTATPLLTVAASSAQMPPSIMPMPVPPLPAPPPMMPAPPPMPAPAMIPRLLNSGASLNSSSPKPARNAPAGSCSKPESREASAAAGLSEEDNQNSNACKSAKKGPVKVRYSDAMDLVLLASVNTIGAHVPKYGEKEKKFEEVASACRSHPVFRRCDKLSGKSVRDRFMKLRNEFRKNDAENARTSGIDESLTEKDRLLYDMWEQIEEERTTRENEASKRTEQNQALLDAGEEMRTLATERVRKRRRNDNENDSAVESGTPSSKSRQNTRQRDVNSSEEFEAAFERADQRHAETMAMEERKIEFNEQMVSMERES